MGKRTFYATARPPRRGRNRHLPWRAQDALVIVVGGLWVIVQPHVTRHRHRAAPAAKAVTLELNLGLGVGISWLNHRAVRRHLRPMRDDFARILQDASAS